MKKVFNTLSAILLATACLVPGLAWADDATPSVALETSGELKATAASRVHSALIQVKFVDENSEKVTGVELLNVPESALNSAVYDAPNKTATIAVSSGDEALKLVNGAFGMLDVIAEGASLQNPVPLKAHVSFFEYIDSANSAEPSQIGSFMTTDVNLSSTKSNSTAPQADGGFGNPIQRGADEGTPEADPSPAVYPRASGVVTPTQAGQNTGLVKTGDILAISGIALGAAAVVVVIAMILSRKKSAARK